MTDPGRLSYGLIGTGIFAAHCLEQLAGWRRPEWVITLPPSISGRGRKVVPTPVDDAASRLSVRVLRSASPCDDGDALSLAREVPVDFTFVIDFGRMMTGELLREHEHIGCLNIHPSSLPRWRGSAPVQRALMELEPEIGVTVFKLERGMDSGPVLARASVSAGEACAGELMRLCAEAGVEAFLKIARSLPISEWRTEPQEGSLATYAAKISPEEERIDWREPAQRIVGKIRALSPRPGAWTTIYGKRLRVLDAEAADVGAARDARDIGLLMLGGGRPAAVASDGEVILRSVQAEGKKIQDAAAWKNGLRSGSEVRLV